MATVRDDHCPVVVDLGTMLCFPRAGSRHRKAKHCTLRMRNPVCREAFQHDLERIQMGAADIHVDDNHAVCMRAIQCLARKHLVCQKQGPRKHWLTLRTRTLMDCVNVLRRMKRMACERLARSGHRASCPPQGPWPHSGLGGGIPMTRVPLVLRAIRPVPQSHCPPSLPGAQGW